MKNILSYKTQSQFSSFNINSLKGLFFLKTPINSIDNNKSDYIKLLSTNSLTKKSLFRAQGVESQSNVKKADYIYKPENFLKDTTSLNCFFLRKSKNFNKGRYSRNRQVYRTGVYMCFYINVAALYGLWFYFYKFKFKFSYFWWVFILLPFSFVNARALKYNLYLPKEFVFHLNNYFN